MKTIDDSHAKNPLSVTVGNEFGQPKAAASAGSVPDADSSILRLTTTAQQYLQRGQSALAFDTLMEAYLLDPLHPLVISCEKAVLPAWESFRTQKIMATSQPPLTDEDRLARLKAEKESQRREKERQIWQQASRTPRVFSGKTAPPTDKPGKTSL